MQKSGQVTYFIIGAVIIILLVITIFLSKTFNFQTEIKSPDEKKVFNFIIDCIKSTSTDAIRYVSESNINVISENNQNLNKNISQLISKYIEINLDRCIQNFESLSEYQIKSGNISIKTNIKDKEVIVSVKWPIQVKKDETTFLIENFGETIVTTKIGRLIEISQNISSRFYPEKSYSVGYVSKIADEEGLTFKTQSSPQNLFVTITDPSGINNAEELNFNFVLT